MVGNPAASSEPFGCSLRRFYFLHLISTAENGSVAAAATAYPKNLKTAVGKMVIKYSEKWHRIELYRW